MLTAILSGLPPLSQPQKVGFELGNDSKVCIKVPVRAIQISRPFKLDGTVAYCRDEIIGQHIIPRTTFESGRVFSSLL